jgi:predicted metal-dependent hydrolase
VTDTAYTVRVSPRARHARLKVSAKDGLIVIVPSDFEHARIPELLAAKRTWLRAAEERAAKNRAFLASDTTALPERVSLRAVGEDWGVTYRSSASTTVAAFDRSGHELLVTGRTKQRDAVVRALQRWLARKTQAHVDPWLRDLADAHGMSIGRVMVRSQRKRWASCSRHRTISLNLRLMFLPPDLVRYVLLHELAHTEVMNHSPRFWALLETLSPGFRELDGALRDGWKLVPGWVR